MINRLDDKATIQNIYQEYQGKTAFLILHGPTGVGKTFLTDNIFRNRETYPPYLRIRVNKQEATEEQGSYISGLAKAFNNYAKKKGEFPTLYEFVEFIRQPSSNKEKNINDIVDLALELADLKKIKSIKDKALERSDSRRKQVEAILDGLNDAARAIILEYISFVANKNKVIVAIECLQYATDYLIAFINELISKSKNLFLIGEYTTEDGNLSSLISQLPEARIEILKVNELKKDELISAAKARIPGPEAKQVCEIINNSYGNTQGNLTHLNQLLKENYREWKLMPGESLGGINYDKAIHYTYLSLSDSQRMILWYILVHQGRVSKILFRELVDYLGYNTTQFINDLKTLEDRDLIEFFDNTDDYSIFHDSLFGLLKEEGDSIKYSLLANRDWLEFYKTIASSNNLYSLNLNKHDILLMQLAFSINLGGSSDIDLINEILKQLGGALNTDNSESTVSKLIKTFYYFLKHKENERAINETYERVIKLLYNLGYSEQICRLNRIYEPQSPSDLSRLVLYSAKISACDKNVIEELNEITEDNSRFLYQGCQLLRIKYYRTFCKMQSAYNIWTKLKVGTRVDDPYFPSILSYSNVCSFNAIKRLKYLELARKSFVAKQDHRHLCATLLNINANLYHLYTMNLICKKGFLKRAHANFDQARSILPSIYYHLNEVLNNKTMLQLVDGSTSLEEIRNGFRLANTVCGKAGNRAVIMSNIIGVSLKLKHTENIESLVNDIMKRTREHIELNCEFASYALLNCYNFFRLKDDKVGMKEAMYFFRKGNALGGGSEYLLSIPLLYEGVFRYKKFRFIHIMNWDIDFDYIRREF